MSRYVFFFNKTEKFPKEKSKLAFAVCKPHTRLYPLTATVYLPYHFIIVARLSVSSVLFLFFKDIFWLASKKFAQMLHYIIADFQKKKRDTEKEISFTRSSSRCRQYMYGGVVI